MDRHDFLAGLHDVLQPRSYLEVGVNQGLSLHLSRVPSVGIDPEFTVVSELMCDLHLARSTSDEFFARRHPLARLPEPRVDLGFVDGLHLAEFALRDVLALERFMPPTGVILIDDTMPRTVETASRHRTTRVWAGDVYKVSDFLRDHRPDLLVMDLDTKPTGTTLVLFPDCSRDGVERRYDPWVEEVAVRPDPQDVPIHVLSRSAAANPQDVLASPVWRDLLHLRQAGAGLSVVRRRLRGALSVASSS